MKRFQLLFAILATLSVSCSNDPTPATQYEPIEKPVSVDTGSSAYATPVRERNRDAWQRPDFVISLLGDLHDKTVADIGAGYGYFSFPLARVAQKVIAIDIDPEAISFMDSIKAQLPEALKSRFETRLALPDDPKLRQGEADHIILVNTYAYLNDRVAYLQRVKSKMPKGGKLVVIDFKAMISPVSPPAAYLVPMQTVQRELLRAGFSKVDVDDVSLEYQYIAIAIN